MKEITSNIDFSDAYYDSCQTKDGNLFVYLNSWDDKILKIAFFNAIQFVYKGGSFISGIYEINNKDSFLLEALSLYYEKIPNEHPFKLFAIIDIEDHYLFQIVAEQILISKE